MKIIKLLLLGIFLISTSYANPTYLNEGIILFEKKEYEKAKFKFEQDLVFNPKSEKAYLYLSKIFNVQNKKELEEQNLDSAILINPKNEEALFKLAKLKLEASDYIKSKELIDQLLIVCKNYCQEINSLKVEIDNSIKK